jgi:hypothetical protein
MKNAIFTTTMLLGLAITPAHATTILFPWVTSSNANTTLGTSASFTSGGITLTAYALPGVNQNPAPALYAKSDGTGETGLGLTNDPGKDNEISAKTDDGIQIDFSNALSKAPNATVTLQIGSVQSGEGWALYGSNTLASNTGSIGKELLSGSATSNPVQTVNLPDWGVYTYYTLVATDPANCTPLANILLGTVTIDTPGTPQNTPTPEPGTLLMSGSALIAVGVTMKKKQKKA